MKVYYMQLNNETDKAEVLAEHKNIKNMILEDSEATNIIMVGNLELNSQYTLEELFEEDYDDILIVADTESETVTAEDFKPFMLFDANGNILYDIFNLDIYLKVKNEICKKN